VSAKRFLTAVAWSTGAVSLAAFAAAWVLAARNGDVFDISAQWGPDRFMVAYALAGTVLASRRRSNPVGWLLVVTQFSERLREQVDLDVLGADLLGVVEQVLAPVNLSLWLRDPAGEREG
jgi:steroid 5-alpha reductase family enzyme